MMMMMHNDNQYCRYMVEKNVVSIEFYLTLQKLFKEIIKLN